MPFATKLCVPAISKSHTCSAGRRLMATMRLHCGFMRAGAILAAMSNSDITIIDDKNLRGIVGPSSSISKAMLVDLVDFIELSTAESVAKENRLIREADGEISWIPLKSP